MSFTYRNAKPSDFNRCVEIRGKTKDNHVSKETLEAWGINEASWLPLIKNKSIIGIVCESSNVVVGYSNGDVNSGEVLVLAVLYQFD
jgi:hypothetical protein